ncbi:MAG: C40 family peptidase [Ginsengibacter sp.]
MNKLMILFIVLVLAGAVQPAIAQTSVNNLQATANNDYSSPNFIDDISFTPEGILQTTESGGSKSIKVDGQPVVLKGNTSNISNESGSIIENLTALQFKYAMMMDVDVESLKNLSLLSFIDEWFGTRYKMGGETKTGIDCSALTSSLLMAVYGFAVPRTARQQYKATQHVKRDELKEGDLVFFNTHGGVSHVGLYLDNNYFVHSSTSQGVTISSLDDCYYSKRFICGGRVEQN